MMPLTLLADFSSEGATAWKADDHDRPTNFDVPFHCVGRSVEFCNRHNAGAALVAPRFGGPGTPGAQRAERGTVVHCAHVVDF